MPFTYEDPFQFKVPSTQQPISAEIIQYILGFLSAADLSAASLVASIWLKNALVLMEKELNKHSDGTFETSHPINVSGINTLTYFFVHSRNKETYSVDFTERKKNIIKVLHKKLMLSIEEACSKSNYKEVEIFLEKAKSLNILLQWDLPTEPSCFPTLNRIASTRALHIAAANGDVECIKLLISKGAMPNRFGSTDKEPKFLATPLNFARDNHHVQAVFTLLILGSKTSNLNSVVGKKSSALYRENDKNSEIGKLITAKTLIEEAEERLLFYILNRNVLMNHQNDIQNYIKEQFTETYAISPELFKNLMLNILGNKKLMYNDDYFDYFDHQGNQRKILPETIQLLINEFVNVLDSLNKQKSSILQDSELQLILASWHLIKGKPQKAIHYYETAKQLFQNQKPQVLTVEEITEIYKKLDVALEIKYVTEPEEQSFLSNLAKKFF